MCDCNILQSRLDCVVAELRAEQEDNQFLRKRRIELRKENYRLADLEAEVKALREINAELRGVKEVDDVVSQFPEGFFPPVV